MLFLLFLLFPFYNHTYNDPVFTVEIQNIKEQKGQLRVGIYKPCDGFPADCKPFDTRIIAASGSNVRVTFTVKPGDYAVAVFQDVNQNGQLDKKAFGIPKEPYGFSNNFRPRFSGPEFNDCRVRVENTGKTILIKLI